MEAAALSTTVDAFIKSSAFRFGDKQSFQVPLTATVVLPGRHAPLPYLMAYKAAMPKRVAVICPGNGGLATQCLLLGAEKVVVFEPRVVFHKALAAIVTMMTDAKLKTFSVVETWPKGTEGPFDLILWLDGFDTLGRPEMALAFLGLLAPEGEMRVEVQHGTHTAVNGSHNAWRPTAETWTKMLASVGAESTPGTAGRLATTSFYTVKAPKKKVVVTPPPAPAPKAETPPAPPVVKLTAATELPPPAPTSDVRPAVYDPENDPIGAAKADAHIAAKPESKRVPAAAEPEAPKPAAPSTDTTHGHGGKRGGGKKS